MIKKEIFIISYIISVRLIMNSNVMQGKRMDPNINRSTLNIQDKSNNPKYIKF